MKKALQNEQEAKALLNKDGSYLKNKALQEVTKHKKYIKRKKGINDAKTQASNFEDNKYFSSLSDMEEFQIMQKELPRMEQSLTPEIKKPQSLNNELPPLYKCAEQLKEKVYLLTNGDTLYFYNSKCYDIVSPKDIISIYRTNVDDKIGNAKSLINISQLHKFLCTDNTIAVDELKNDKRAAVLLNGIYDVEEEKLMPHTHKELVFSYINADYVEKQERYDIIR